jgi:hypothetical protein
MEVLGFATKIIYYTSYSSIYSIWDNKLHNSLLLASRYTWAPHLDCTVSRATGKDRFSGMEINCIYSICMSFQPLH